MNLDFSVVTDSLPYLWKGMQYTLQLTATSAHRRPVLRHVARTGASVAEQDRCRYAAASYVNLMRSIPLVLVIFWFFFLCR